MTAQSDAPAPEAPAEKPKRRKKKKRRAAAAEPLRPALNAEGRERPAFILSFPEDPELERLIAAFEAGNHALVRSDAPGLSERSERADVRDAALELRRRIDPDPLVRYLLLVSVGLLLVLTAWAYLGHAP